jgi:hypothetical protein
MTQTFHRIGNSKEPTSKQMLHIAQNLQKKTGYSAYLGVEAWHFSSGNKEVNYSIYLENFPTTKRFKTWPEVINAYRKLMKGASYGNLP